MNTGLDTLVHAQLSPIDSAMVRPDAHLSARQFKGQSFAAMDVRLNVPLRHWASFPKEVSEEREIIMGRAFCIAILTAALPFVSASAIGAGCVVQHHRVAHKVAARRIVHHASGIGIAMDQARVFAFAKPVKTVFVGNPWIADVTMIDSRHAFVLGKTFGVTNLIALDTDGTQVTNQQIMVVNSGSAVTINRGANQFDYVCTSAHCETMPRPGDPKEYVSNTEDSANAHEGYGLAHATNAGTTSQVAAGQ